MNQTEQTAPAHDGASDPGQPVERHDVRHLPADDTEGGEA